MKAIIITALVILATLTGIGLTQNYLNDPTRGCTKYDASNGYWGYDCKNNTGFYEQK